MPGSRVLGTCFVASWFLVVFSSALILVVFSCVSDSVDGTQKGACQAPYLNIVVATAPDKSGPRLPSAIRVKGRAIYASYVVVCLGYVSS